MALVGSRTARTARTGGRGIISLPANLLAAPRGEARRTIINYQGSVLGGLMMNAQEKGEINPPPEGSHVRFLPNLKATSTSSFNPLR
ncbi:hypothetical protein E2C01_058199 [Portunus trituberculatus]|uniref:Uncharacterized protein n=1 Tax=Portunus trituberculatus TaxID=210409 RepID=A0A5B7H2C6_PORTR|nr:hypothetical protein [Portunus trituberculatus]